MLEFLLEFYTGLRYRVVCARSGAPQPDIFEFAHFTDAVRFADDTFDNTYYSIQVHRMHVDFTFEVVYSLFVDPTMQNPTDLATDWSLPDCENSPMFCENCNEWVEV